MLAKFFTAIFAKIAAVVAWFGELAVAIFEAMWDFVRDAACWPFEQLLDVIVSALSAVDTSSIDSSVFVWNGLPAEIVNILGLLGVGQASLIVVSAIGIRIALQLIPFTRLGS